MGQFDVRKTLAKDGDQLQQEIEESLHELLLESFFFFLEQYWTIKTVSWNASNRPRSSRQYYLKLLHRSVVQKAVELDNKLQTITANLEVIFGMFRFNMLSTLQTTGRKEPSEALSFWKEQNEKPRIRSQLPLNMVAYRACLASQVSSSSCERLFSDMMS